MDGDFYDLYCKINTTVTFFAAASKKVNEETKIVTRQHPSKKKNTKPLITSV